MMAAIRYCLPGMFSFCDEIASYTRGASVLRVDAGGQTRKKERNFWTNLKFLFGWYIDDFFFFVTDKYRVMRIYDHVCGALERAGLPPKPLKSKGPHENKEVTILGIEFDKMGSPEPNREKLAHLLSETGKALKTCLWNVVKLQKLLGSWNWFFLQRYRLFPYSRNVLKL